MGEVRRVLSGESRGRGPPGPVDLLLFLAATFAGSQVAWCLGRAVCRLGGLSDWNALGFPILAMTLWSAYLRAEAEKS